ncbi:MAG: GspH/FimT family pseudopilin [Burkholderiales bacterium]|nr:GspH/FimT family pseudopilin [Burkholderiales bacterium]
MLTRIAAARTSAGFTLMELMVTITIMAILMTVGLPAFRDMLRNYEVRVAAESVSNGLQRARAEAVARNAPVQFALGAGSSWTVDYVTKPVSSDPPIDSRSSTDGSPNVVLSAVASDLATAATTVTFNSLGQVVANADASQTLRRVSLNASASGGTQSLRVEIGAGGNARVCDPSLPNYPVNLRGCTP